MKFEHSCSPEPTSSSPKWRIRERRGEGINRGGAGEGKLRVRLVNVDIVIFSARQWSAFVAPLCSRCQRLAGQHVSQRPRTDGGCCSALKVNTRPPVFELANPALMPKQKCGRTGVIPR